MSRPRRGRSTPNDRPPRELCRLRDPGHLWRWIQGPPGSLRRTFLGGSAWHLGVAAYNSTFLLVQALLAAHLFADPGEFGRVNAVMWAYTLAEVFTFSGLALALTQHQGDPAELAGVVWTAQAARGAVLGLGVGLIGSAMAVHYGDPAIAPLAWTAALSAPLAGLAGLGPVLALRELRFRRVAIASAIETTLGALAGCVLIATLRSAWAVVLGLNTMAVARIVSSYWLRRELPRPDFRWRRLRPFAGFAASALITSVLAFGNERLDDLAVGTILGMGGLGLYHVAFLYANLPGLKLAQVLGNLLLPTLARVREDPPRLRALFGKVAVLMLALGTAVFVPLWAAAPHLFEVVGGGRLRAAVPAFRVLCVFGLVRFFLFAADALCYALGKPRHVTFARLIQFAVMASLVVPCTRRFGTLGAGAAVAAGTVLSAAYAAMAVRNLLAPRPGALRARVPASAWTRAVPREGEVQSTLSP